MSACALFYSLASLYSYFGFKTNKFIDISQSYFASFKVSAILLGHFFDTSLPISYYFEFNFAMMTLLITVDAYYGFNELIRETRLKDESLIEEERSIFLDNWKINLFYKERESSELMRTFGLLLLTLEGIFSCSSMFYTRYYLFVSFTFHPNFIFSKSPLVLHSYTQLCLTSITMAPNCHFWLNVCLLISQLSPSQCSSQSQQLELSALFQE